VTVERAGPVTRERRLANLRATLARPGGPPAGPDELPARAPFAGRRSPQLAARLASALGADVAEVAGGWLVRRTVTPIDLPLDRDRLAELPGHPPPDAPLICIDTETTGLATAAGTLAFLVGLARWDGDAFCQTQLLLPDHADEPALLAEIDAWIPPDAWLVSYNGRGFDWPLIEARFRLAGRAAPEHAGHLDLLPFVRRVFRHRMEDARLRTVEGELLGVSRVGDVEGWEIPAIYLDVLRGGPVDALAGVVIHNEKDVRSLGLLLAHVERRYADRAARHDAPRGDLAGLARAYGRGKRHEEALACLDDALASAPPVRDPFGRTPVGPALARERLDDERETWWDPRIQPTFGGRPPRAGWRGPLANGRGGALGPSPSASAWEAGGTWDAATRWTDERLAAERARLLRRLGRWTEAAEAWQTAAAAGGGLGVIAWIEVAKLREHRMADPGGALAATRAAWRQLERLRGLGRPHPRLEADLQRRGARLSARLRRRDEAVPP
jgi:tetratricopeptide (TPR) repeat protein